MDVAEIFNCEEMNTDCKDDGDLCEFIQDMTPHFEESLTRAFKNENLKQHRQELKQVIQDFEDALFQVADTVIELRKLQLPWIPDFRINQLKAHLETLCLDLSLNLGSLKIQGDYEANTASLQAFLPVTHQGKITITFNNMTAKGKVGLFIREDSLLPENYDLVYEASGVDVKVEYTINGGQTVVTEISKPHVEETLGISMWNQLTQTLTELLSRQLRKVVSEFSIADLFLEKKEYLRNHERALILRSNHVADSLLCAAKDYIVQKGRQIITPNMDIIFKGRPCSIHLGKLRTCQGYVKDLSTLTRRKPWSCFDDGNEMLIFGCFTLQEFKHGYRLYEAQYETTKVSGSINMSVYENNISLRIVFIRNNEHCDCYLGKLRLGNIRDLDIDVSGLASLGWLAPRMRSWIFGNFQQKTVAALQEFIRAAFNYGIQNTKYEYGSVEKIKNYNNKIT